MSSVLMQRDIQYYQERHDRHKARHQNAGCLDDAEIRRLLSGGDEKPREHHSRLTEILMSIFGHHKNL